MATLRMFLPAVSLSITMLLWPPTSPAAPQSCAENMNKIYRMVDAYDLLDNGTAQEYINDTLPAFEAACPTEAKSIKDLENGRYLRKLAAERAKRKKSHRHIKDSGREIPDSILFENLEIQR